jgi:hypothetical protein
VGGGVSAQVGRSGRIFFNESYTYAPSYFYSLTPTVGAIPVGAITGGGDFPLGAGNVAVSDTNTSFTYGLSRRSSIEALGSYRHSDLGRSSQVDLSTLQSYSVGGRFRRGLTRNATLRIGYIYRNGQYVAHSTSRSTVVHDIDSGIDYRRALSLTRRTSFEFGVGSAIVNTPAAGSLGSSLQYRVVGDGALTHMLGRTWLVRAVYSRGVGFVEGFAEPIFSDGSSATVNGFIGRRLNVMAMAGASVGNVGLGVARNSFRMYNAVTRARMALSSMWAVYGEYLYYHNDVGQALSVPAGVPRRLGRHSISGGLTLWVPLLRG